MTALGRAALALAVFLVLATPASADESQVLETGAAAPTGQFSPQASTTSQGVDIDRYQQEVDGVPVLGAQVVVADPNGAPAAVAADSSVPNIAPPPAATLSKQDAIHVAKTAISLQAARAPVGAHQAIDPDRGDALVWAVRIPGARPWGDYEVLVDALTGDVLSSTDLMHHVNGTASVFVPNPVVENGKAEGLADNGDADSPLLTALRVPVVLHHLLKRGHCLDGAYAHATTGPKSKEVCRKTRHWRGITRADNRFEALNAYFNVDRTLTYIRSLGFPQVGFRRLPLRTDAFPDDNSGFSSFTRDISYGTGGVDDAEDADVVIHEYGHSIQDSQVPGYGVGDQGGSMGEGWADYLAAVMTAQVPGTTEDQQACIFEWDSTSLGLPCLRRVDLPQTVSEGLAAPCLGEIHCAGQTWSGALWKLRGELGSDASGQSVMDKLVLQSHFLLTPKTTYAKAATAVLTADDQLYGGIHRDVLAAEFTARGLLG
ncbi:MAG: hypothetical protein QOG62_1557 [Thermoleophilaceae bacterium]|jgi:hypothetical protein|nr:hypothetical protein [Thermoleophilaceae bacterium]